MALASPHLFLPKVSHEYIQFWAVMKLFWTFSFIYDSFLCAQKHLTPFLLDDKYFSSCGKISFAHIVLSLFCLHLQLFAWPSDSVEG